MFMIIVLFLCYYFSFEIFLSYLIRNKTNLNVFKHCTNRGTNNYWLVETCNCIISAKCIIVWKVSYHYIQFNFHKFICNRSSQDLRIYENKDRLLSHICSTKFAYFGPIDFVNKIVQIIINGHIKKSHSIFP